MQLSPSSIALLIGAISGAVALAGAALKLVDHVIRRREVSNGTSLPAQRELESERHRLLIESITRLVSELHELTGKTGQLIGLVSQAHTKLEVQADRIDQLLKELEMQKHEIHGIANHIKNIRYLCPRQQEGVT